jgi:branched-chain amino acid transport system permease protein
MMFGALDGTNVLAFFISGLASGGIIALSALGLVVVYRATGVLNFAQGAVGAIGAMVVAKEFLGRGRNQWVGYIAAIVIAVLLSLLYGVVFARRLAHRDPVVKAIGTLGFALALLGVAGWRWTGRAETLRLGTDKHSFAISGVQVTATRAIVIALAVVVTVAISALLSRTRVGLNMRALANDRELASVIGVGVNRTEMVAWLISGLLSGVTGIFAASVVQLEPYTLTFLVIPAIAAALVGQLKSLWWTFAGAMIIGVIESELTNFESVKPYKSLTELAIGAGIVLLLHRSKAVSFTSES